MAELVGQRLDLLAVVGGRRLLAARVVVHPAGGEDFEHVGL
jgi:hypothetical protein